MPQMHLDTIPVWDAYKKNSECPLCLMEQASEAQFLDTALGGAVMEPDVRIATNQSGFCGPHFKLLWDAQNRLGLALLAHTHLKDRMAALYDQSNQLLEALGQEKKKNALSRAASGVAKASPFHKQLEALTRQVEARGGSCYICERIEKTMHRYVETLLYMWRKEPDFKAAFAASKGVCLHHYPLLLQGAARHLSGHAQIEFIEALVRLQKENLDRVEHDLEWFTLKFDYRNQDKPWGNSKDAVERALNKLQGRVIPAKQED